MDSISSGQIRDSRPAGVVVCRILLRVLFIRNRSYARTPEPRIDLCCSVVRPDRRQAIQRRTLALPVPCCGRRHSSHSTRPFNGVPGHRLLVWCDRLGDVFRMRGVNRAQTALEFRTRNCLRGSGRIDPGSALLFLPFQWFRGCAGSIPLCCRVLGRSSQFSGSDSAESDWRRLVSGGCSTIHGKLRGTGSLPRVPDSTYFNFAIARNSNRLVLEAAPAHVCCIPDPEPWSSSACRRFGVPIVVALESRSVPSSDSPGASNPLHDVYCPDIGAGRRRLAVKCHVGPESDRALCFSPSGLHLCDTKSRNVPADARSPALFFYVGKCLQNSPRRSERTCHSFRSNRREQPLASGIGNDFYAVRRISWYGP